MTTDEMIRQAIRHNEIGMIALGGLLALVAAVLLWVTIREHREKMRMLRRTQAAGGAWRPVVLEDTQVIDGRVYHRMGVPERR
jgi:hypothetical protein